MPRCFTLPKSVTQSVGPAECFDGQARDGRIVLTPVSIQRGDAVRAKRTALGLGEQDVADAVVWARAPVAAPLGAAGPKARTTKRRA
jgi:hypothetical protein